MDSVQFFMFCFSLDLLSYFPIADVGLISKSLILWLNVSFNLNCIRMLIPKKTKTKHIFEGQTLQ